VSSRPSSEPTAPAGGIGFDEALRVWVRVALLSFGGPAGQIAVIHRIIVEEKKWIDEDRFLHALNFCMLLPGPEAQQLATYLGWLMHRTRGALAAGLLFILPGVISIMVLSWIYVLAGRAAPVAAILFGLKAAVLAIVLDALVRIGRRALTGKLRILVAAAGFGCIFFLALPFPLIVAAAALTGIAAAALAGPNPVAASQPDNEKHRALRHRGGSIRSSLTAAAAMLLFWLVPVALISLLRGPDDIFSAIGSFFSRVALFSFGGAYAVLSYVAQAAVETHHWLTAPEMIDGLGMAETTPGPLIMVTQFVGFLAGYRNAGALPPLLAGTLGGLLTSWVTFAPCFVWILAGAPFVERLRRNRWAAAALAMVTAAVVGVILNLSLWFALHVLFGRVTAMRSGPFIVWTPDPATVDWSAWLLSASALVAVFRCKLNYGLLIGASAAVGLLLWVSGLH